MPVYRTSPGVSLDDLVASIESRGETIIEATFTDNRASEPGEWVIITRTALRVVTNLGQTEAR